MKVYWRQSHPCKYAIEENRADKVTLLRSILRQLDLFIKAIIPSDLIKDLNPFISYPVTFLIIGAVAVTWAFFVYLGVTKQNLPFLTTMTDGLNCRTVERDNTGMYLLDSNGYWEGSANFTLAKAVYRLVVSNIVLTMDDYVSYMQQVRTNLQLLKAKLLVSDLNSAVVAWVGFSWTSNKGNNRIELVGETNMIYSGDHIAATLGSSKGVCNAVMATFDDVTAVYKVSINYKEYMSNPLCFDALQLEPSLLGYNNVTDGENIRLRFDLTGAIIANAISLSVIAASELEYIPGLEGCYDFNKLYYHGPVCWRKGYHPKFPGMDLLTVFRYFLTAPGSATISKYSAVLKVGSYWGITALIHKGNGDYPPTFCRCNGNPNAYPDPHSPCNRFDFVNGLLLFKNVTSLQNIMDVILRWAFGEATSSGVYGTRWSPKLIQRLGYVMFYSSVYGGKAIEYNATLADDLFGQTGCRGCVALTFTKMEIEQEAWSISPYYTQLMNGACSGANVLIADDAWARVFATPFANLTEAYSVCQYPFQFFIFLVLGSSFGNAASVFPAAVAIAIVILTVCKYVGLIPDFYSKEERVRISDDLSIALLKLRDGQIDHNDPQYHSLSKISHELIVMATSAEHHELVSKGHTFPHVDNSSTAPTNPENVIPSRAVGPRLNSSTSIPVHISNQKSLNYSARIYATADTT